MNYQDILLDSIREHLDFLIKAGYRIGDPQQESSPTVARTCLVGSNIGLVVSVDIRDQVTDLYLAKVIDGKIAGRGKGYYNSLSGYLRERKLPWKTALTRSTASGNFADAIKRDLEIYADVILNSAPSIVDGSEGFDEAS